MSYEFLANLFNIYISHTLIEMFIRTQMIFQHPFILLMTGSVT